MKLKLLIAFMMLSLVSCSDDDTSSNGSGQLDKYVITLYGEDGEIFDKYDIKFDNNRITGIYFYLPSGQVVDKREFFYNASGSLSKSEIYRFDETEPYIVHDLSYDNEGKITTVNELYVDEWGDESVSISNFQYNTDNTITYTRENNNGVISTTTYYKNTFGQIYKIVDPETIQEVTYEGDNISTYTYGGGTMSFTYDNVNTPVGPMLQSQLNHFGGDMQNTILYAGFPQITFGVSKYLIEQTNVSGSGSSSTSYVYEFNDNGYPVKIKSFKAGNTQPSMMREIFYK